MLDPLLTRDVGILREVYYAPTAEELAEKIG
jgi:hypothetical protein